MIRTQIQLPEDRYARLKKAAARKHQSIAACIREGIDAYLVQAETAEPDLATLAGQFRPTPADDLKDHDRWWADAAVPPASAPSA